MAAAIIDLRINEGDTFIMNIDFWETVDMTNPVDLSDSTFTGSFKIGQKVIPMTMVVVDNVLTASVPWGQMGDLSSQGKYDIDQLIAGDEKFRLIQGDVQIDAEVTT